jgi:uncharacterized protein YciI
MHYLLHAYDFTDDEALERRMAARPFHFEGARRLKAAGHFIVGGALLSPEGKMIGSMMLLDFPSDDDLQAWLEIEPYITGRVWDRIDVKPFLLADV